MSNVETRPLLFFGTAGWSYSDWEGIVYPAKKGSDFHALVFLAQYIDIVEINAINPVFCQGDAVIRIAVDTGDMNINPVERTIISTVLFTSGVNRRCHVIGVIISTSEDKHDIKWFLWKCYFQQVCAFAISVHGLEDDTAWQFGYRWLLIPLQFLG